MPAISWGELEACCGYIRGVTNRGAVGCGVFPRMDASCQLWDAVL